jgi:hypothetical protein
VIALTLLGVGGILHASCNTVLIDQAMPSNTIPPNSTKQLLRWRVMEVVWPDDTRTRHICAEDATNNYGVATSSIQDFDPVAMTIKTRSDKTYHLIGQSEKSVLGEAAWRKWCIENDIVKEQDLSSEYQHTEPEPTTITFKRVSSRSTSLRTVEIT